MTYKFLFVVFLMGACSLSSRAQLRDFPQPVSVKTDSVRVLPDSLAKALTDTSKAKADSLLTTKSDSGIDSVVTYSAADSIVYSLSSKTMFLYGKGDIKYKELGLRAEQIDINWNSSLLNAQGVADTSDSSKSGFRGLPELIDGGEKYHGDKIAYNFKTKKGKIDVGKTEMDKSYYRGEEIKKMSADVLFVEDGRYTTCDAEHPHYYFASPEMKVVLKERIVARPIYLYISDVPILALPFGIFPTERGRRSGIIGPAYGESTRGRYLLHLGYYWAINDYLDWSARADGYTKGTWVLYSDLRYALRYDFSGSISASFGKKIDGERGDPLYQNAKEFNGHWGHNQDFNPTTRLVVDFTLSSASYYQNTSSLLSDLLRQTVYSNATLTKSWEGTPNSMSINVSRTQNLTAKPGELEISDGLPNISFSRGQSFPFRFGKNPDGSGSSQAWYELIGYTYNGQLVNKRDQYKSDSTGYTKVDEQSGVQHTIAVNVSPKLGYFTIAPFFNYTEKWYGTSNRKQLLTSITGPDTARDTTYSLLDSDVKAFKAVRYYDLGVSVGTKFFGTLQPNILDIKGIRHQVSPSISYTYQPDFSKSSYGYFGTYVDQFGQTQKYGFYDQQVFGGAPGEERQALGLRIGNVIEMKTSSHDTSGQDNKFQLLNFDVSTGYNFARDSLKFDEISLGYRTSIGTILNISGSSSFNLYKFEPYPQQPVAGRRVNKFLLGETGQIAQLTNFSLSLSTSLSGEKKKSTSGPERSPADSLRQKNKSGQLYDDPLPDFSIPWKLDLSYNFSQSQQDPRSKLTQANISVGLSFSLTENWKISASTNYDITNKVVAAPQVNVYRDLHCWEINFNWVPTGPYRNYRFEIRLKAPQLQDVKLTKQQSSSGVY